jgi:uncharacterized protein (DUF58 family)
MARIMAIAALAALLAVPAALADTQTGNQNPDLVVTVSLSPDTVAIGETATAVATVTNQSAARQSVSVTATLSGPGGVLLVRTERVSLKPGEAFSESASYTRDADDPAGTYSLTVEATSKTGTSSATASTVYL